MSGKPTNKEFNQKLEHMVDTLRSEILGGTYAPGEYLPSEMSQSVRFELSNKSVRKGLEVLVAEDLIEKIPKVGSRVKGRSPVTLTLAYNATNLRDLDQEGLLEDFQKRYSWIKVNTRLYDGLPDLSAEGDAAPFDLITLNNVRFQELVEKRNVHMLESLVPPSDTYPFLAEQFTFNDQLLVQPLVFSPVVLCYNKEHFRECGLPEPDGSWTWDDLMRNASILTNNNGRYGFSFHVPDGNRWPIFLLQSGEKFEWDGEKIKNIRNSRLMEGIRLCKKMIHDRSITPAYMSVSNGEHSRMFQEGKISMMLISYFGLNSLKHLDLEFDITPIPFMYEPRTLSISIGVGIHKLSKHKEEAQLLINYLVSERGRDYILDHTLSIPSFRQMNVNNTKPGLNCPSRYAIFREMLFSCRTHRDLNLPMRAFPQLLELLKAFWAGMMNEDELYEQIAEKLSLQDESSDSEKEFID